MLLETSFAIILVKCQVNWPKTRLLGRKQIQADLRAHGTTSEGKSPCIKNSSHSTSYRDTVILTKIISLNFDYKQEKTLHNYKQFCLTSLTLKLTNHGLSYHHVLSFLPIMFHKSAHQRDCGIILEFPLWNFIIANFYEIFRYVLPTFCGTTLVGHMNYYHIKKCLFTLLFFSIPEIFNFYEKGYLVPEKR